MAKMISWFKKKELPKHIQWEYTLLPIMSVDGEPPQLPEYLPMMNALGLTGWELVTVNSTCMIFKKAKNAQVR